ncbi:dead end protein 1 isoform X1 [Tachysurus fulvidraco]|uniref:dead end protein 1 isoform X1 n=1 Tax=Tachysurus fulvidraco TaxID=1234273 RepID=UPI001FEED679|nr:dead end protein 1 isoform X1 [Tachysurus fulvidraco]
MEQNTLQMVNPERLESLEKWIKENNITLTQINGQRIYGGPPPGWRGPTPGRGCEVFISHIPRDVYEDQLIPLFQSVAPLYEFRLMMNFSGQNRGFAYAKYGDAASAAGVIQALNLYPLQSGVRLSVRRSTEKRQLCLADLPSTIGRNELLAVLRQITDGVEGVNVRTTGPKEKDVTALVHYSSHHAASMAKKVLVQAFRKLYGLSISVRWMTGSGKSRHEGHDEERLLVSPCLKPAALNTLTPPRIQLGRDHEHPPPLPTPPSPLHSQSFSRAVGGLTPQVMSVMLPMKPRRSVEEPLYDSVHQLRWLCELHGLGLPLYNMRYDRTGPDGFLYFAYRVLVPGLAVPFCGIVHVLPSTCANNMEAEVQRAAAKQILGALWQARNL